LKTRIIRIGNSRGVCIPKAWLEQLRLRTEVEITLQADKIVIRAARNPRDGWEASFAALPAQTDEGLLDAATPTQWDREEWDW
jgi:antitoxin MazE